MKDRKVVMVLLPVLVIALAAGVLKDPYKTSTPAPRPLSASESPLIPPETGWQTIQGDQKLIGCREIEDLTRLLALYQDSRDTWAVTLTDLIENRSCRSFEPGQSVQVVEATFLGKQIDDGDRLYWLPRELVAP